MAEIRMWRRWRRVVFGSLFMAFTALMFMALQSERDREHDRAGTMFVVEASTTERARCSSSRRRPPRRPTVGWCFGAPTASRLASLRVEEVLGLETVAPGGRDCIPNR